MSIHPANSRGSIAHGVYDGQQVGRTEVPNGERHAALWSGTSASFVNLNPAGATGSEAYAIHNGMQVGYSEVNGVLRASFWHGTAASWEDLSLALDGSWGETLARSIWSDGTTISIGGHGVNNITGRAEALLWTQVIPEPTAVAILLTGAAALLVRRRNGA